MDHLFSEPVPTSFNPSTPGAPAVTASPIRILIVDDQNFVRKMLQYALESHSDFEIVGTVNSGQEAIAQIQQHQTDIALVDIEMPGMNGLDITRTVSEQYPQTKVLVLSIHDDDTYIRDALQAGAKGYLLKNTPPAELAHAIRFVQRGYLQLGPGLFEKLEGYPAPTQSASAPDPLVSPLVSPFVPTEVTDPAIAIPSPATLKTQTLDLDWSAATHEAIDSLPKLWVRGVLYLTLAFVVIVLPWAAFSRVDEVGVAQGRLEPKGKTIRLDAPVAGTVAVIHVQEGQSLQKGQPLMALQSDVANADLQQAQVKLEGLLNRQTQLTAVKTQLENSLSTAREQARALAASQQVTIDKALNQQNSLQESLALHQDLLSKDRVKIAQLKTLSAQGVVPRSQADDAERVMIQNSQLLQKTQTDIQQAQGEVQKQQREYQRILRDGELNVIDKTKQVKELQSQISDAQSEAGQTQNLIKSLQYQRKQRVLFAPTSGTLFQLPIQHPGAVVQPGQTVAQIAPQTSRLVLRARMDNKQMGFMKVGLPAKLKFDAYPFQDYGILSGRISWIAPTSTLASESSIPSTPSTPPNGTSPLTAGTSSFEVEVELAQPTLQIQGQAIALKAGQTATAEVIIRQRRVLDLFLDPFKKLSKNGLQL